MGQVFLVGAGPGDPELLTGKALRVLRSANIVLHDSLVSTDILRLIPESAERVDVGKRCGHRLLTQREINSLLVAAAASHEVVVRLKGGDPLVFGRAGEEIQALRDAHVEFTIIPGISAAFAAAASARVSLTDRRIASRVLFTTFSRSASLPPRMDLCSETTVVVYMPGPDYAQVARWLVEGGLVRETPCLVISKATQSEQTIQATNLAGLNELSALPAPAVLIVGRVVGQPLHEAAACSWACEPSSENVLGKMIS
jgi:uroporphyrin-III C-methyltransferase